MFISNDMPDQSILAAAQGLNQTCVSTLGHLRDHGFALGLVPNRRPIRFLGTAVTVRIPHLDSTAVHVAVDRLRSGDVLVVDQSGDRDRSCFGGLVSYTAKARGAAGAVIDGSINDHDETEAYDFPVFSRGFSPLTTRILRVEGAINVPVQIAGCVVNPGDVVFADSDGVAFLAPADVHGLAEVLRAKEEAEGPARESIAAGGRIADFSGAAKHFA